MSFLHGSTFNLRRILSFVASDWTEPISITLSIIEHRSINNLRRANSNIQQNTWFLFLGLSIIISISIKKIKIICISKNNSNHLIKTSSSFQLRSPPRRQVSPVHIFNHWMSNKSTIFFGWLSSAFCRHQYIIELVEFVVINR